MTPLAGAAECSPSYGLERTKLGHAIVLDESESQLDPQNPNLRGHPGGEEQVDPLDEIIRSFNERWFQGWKVTLEEQRMKVIYTARDVRAHPDYSIKYDDNQDPYSRELALRQILKDVMLKRRRDDLDLYKLYASDDGFKTAWFQGVERMLNQEL